MRVLVSGSTGLIGSSLVRSLESGGHDVVRLLRPQSRTSANGIMWDPAARSLEPGELEGFDAVVHLSGENIANRRWSAAQMARIKDSRIGSTTLLAETLASLDSPPSVFACASAGGYYGDRGDDLLDEDAAVGTGFLAAGYKGVGRCHRTGGERGHKGGNPQNRRCADRRRGYAVEGPADLQAGAWRQARLRESVHELADAVRRRRRDCLDVGARGYVRSGERQLPESGHKLGVHAGAGESAQASGGAGGPGIRAEVSSGRPSGSRDVEREDGPDAFEGEWVRVRAPGDRRGAGVGVEGIWRV